MLSTGYILNVLKTECRYRDGDSILVGVSGGADSVALLHVLHAAKIPVAAAHVNYGLRGDESDGDENFVSELCARLNIPLYLRKTDRAELDTLANNLQDAARRFRREFFNEIRSKESMQCIAVAHNAGDQVETVLINFMRGSGLRGMAGIKFVNGGLIHPLLETSRSEIETYLDQNNQSWREDSSNQKDDYLRNRLRHQLVPVMNSLDDRNGKGIVKTIHNLSASAKLLRELVLPWWERAELTPENTSRFDGRRFNKKVIAEFITPHLLMNYMLDFLGTHHEFTAQSYSDFVNGQPGKKIERGGTLILNDREEIIVFNGFYKLEYPCTLFPGFANSDWSCELVSPENPELVSGNEALLSNESAGSQLIVRAWIEGDKMQPFGFSGTKKVSDILTEMKVPLYLKENYPVVTCNDEIAWIPGYRIAEKFKVTGQTKTALHIKWNR